jgi:hypothetical protein
MTAKGQTKRLWAREALGNLCYAETASVHPVVGLSSPWRIGMRDAFDSHASSSSLQEAKCRLASEAAVMPDAESPFGDGI